MNNILNSKEVENIRKKARKKANKSAIIYFLVGDVGFLLLIISLGISVAADKELIVDILKVFMPIFSAIVGFIVILARLGNSVPEKDGISKAVLSKFDANSYMEVIPNVNNSYYNDLKERVIFSAYKNSKIEEIEIRIEYLNDHKIVDFEQISPYEFYKKYYLAK